MCRTECARISKYQKKDFVLFESQKSNRKKIHFEKKTFEYLAFEEATNYLNMLHLI